MEFYMFGNFLIAFKLKRLIHMKYQSRVFIHNLVNISYKQPGEQQGTTIKAIIALL